MVKKSTASSKKFWLLCLFWFAFVVFLFVFDGVKLEFGKSLPIEPVIVTDVSTENFSIFTGVLLTSPSWKNRKEWEYFADSTQEIFYGWLYNLTKREAKSLLLAMAERWVDTRLLMENRQYKDYRDSRQHLVDFFAWSSVVLQTDEHLWLNFNHTKTFVNDTYAIVQTANLTHSAFTKNIEHFFVTADEEIRKNLQELFALDREGISLHDDAIHPNILVCPINCRAKIEALIENAEQSVYLMHQYLKDDRLSNLLQEKLASGLDVQLVLSDTDSNYLLYDDFWSQNVHIVKKPYIHTKLLLIDNTYLVIGSMNFSTNALDNNREIWLVVLDREVIQQIRQQFFEFFD